MDVGGLGQGQIPYDLRETAAAKCRDPVSRKDFQQEGEECGFKLMRGRLGSSAKRKWLEYEQFKHSRVGEDREERMEEVKAHCERCYNDKEETVGGARGQDTSTEGTG